VPVGEGIESQMITVSEIEISVPIEGRRADFAVCTLRDALLEFGAQPPLVGVR
jgi:hypothetical protein